VYGRQYGEYMTGGVAGQVELFSYLENGSSTRIGMTNRANLGKAIFGTTDQFGNSRVTFDINNRYYDFQVHDPGTPTDSSPNCFWLDSLPHYGHYRFEFHWLKVQDPSSFTAYPFDPVYHYDLMDGFNQLPNKEPGGFSTDDYGLTDWADYQAQTFVVPPGQNRIIAAKAFCVRQHDTRFTMKATIREGGPTGPQVGPVAVSREVYSNEFPNVLMIWPVNAVPVIPGETYALRLDSLNGQGFNVYATKRNNYTGGDLYNGSQRIAGRDMIAVVIGARIGKGTAFLRGDCNQDLEVDLSDAIAGLGHLFLGRDVSCLEACNFDGLGDRDLTDVIYLLNHLYLGQSALPAPYPGCGEDPAGGDPDCEESACP